MGESSVIKSALFLDFDNIYLGLKEIDNESELADLFATRPGQWLSWLSISLGNLPGYNKETARRILVRKCYLNPSSFGRFRPYFTNSGFETIDCPPLTSRGKTSADIHMVLDILDLMNDDVHINEFIILSADADFTPVLLKLRKNNRFSSLVVVGGSSPAYRAVSDNVIDQDTFVEGIIAEVRDAVFTTSVKRPAATLPEGLVKSSSELLVGHVRASSAPVSLAELAQLLTKSRPSLRDGWSGTGTFGSFLDQLELDGLTLSRAVPGHLYDPGLHEPPAADKHANVKQQFRVEHPELEQLASRVHEITETPYILPEHYARIFQWIEDTIKANGYHMTTVSKTVRDLCIENDISVGRQHINFILRGIAFVGHRFGGDEDGAKLFASKMLENTRNLCKNSRLDLSDEDDKLLEKWIMGGMGE